MNEQTDQNPNLPPVGAPKPPKPTGAKSSDKKPPPPAPAPNIQFVGRRQVTNKETGKLEWLPIEAPERITDGETRIKLPATSEQRSGFYHERAAQIIALFPDDYKIPTDKGGRQ